MKTIEVLKRFPYRGEYRDPGDVLEVPTKFAKVITAIGKAKIHVPKPKVTPKAKAAPKAKAPPKVEVAPKGEDEKPKRTYRRRNVTAGNTRNGYSTTDLKPEE